MTNRHKITYANMIKCHKEILYGKVEPIMENNLKLLRKQKKKTQLMVQIDTGIEQALLSKYENGLRIPPTETLLLLADFYNVSIDYILYRTDNPEINK